MKDQSIEELVDQQRNNQDTVDAKDIMLPVDLGLDDDKLNEAIKYLGSATSDVPKYMESFNNEKLKNITAIATIAQMARVPGLIKQINEINATIISSNVYNSMDPVDLIKMSNSLSNELRLILETSRKTLDTLNTLDLPPSANQKLLEQILQMPEEDILAMREFVESKKRKTNDRADS